MTSEQKYLLRIIRAVLHDNQQTITERPQLAEGLNEFCYESVPFDYNKLLNEAKRNVIANTAAYVICKDESVPADIRKKFERERMLITMQQIKQAAVIRELADIMDAEKMQCIFLKGSVLKALYPDSFMRSMSDIDVLISDEDIQALAPVLEAKGFIPDKAVQGVGNHYVYEKYDVVHIEFHPDLESIESGYGKEVFSRLHPEAITMADEMDPFTHSVALGDHEYARCLAPDYHYVYVILHMLKHFLGSGTGIRSFMDIWVMNHAYGQEWNRSEINALLDHFGLLKFEQYALALTDIWFDLEDKSCITESIDADVLADLEEYILGSGVYGNLGNHIIKEMKQDTSAAGKMKYLLHAYFRPLSMMREMYPVLNRAPFLLPLVWPYRAVEIFVKRGRSARNKLRFLANADEELAVKQKKLFDSVI